MKNSKPIAIGGILILIIGAGAWWATTRSRPGNIFAHWGSMHRHTKSTHRSNDPLLPAITAYKAGKYQDAEAASQRLIDQASGSKDIIVRKDAVRARYILAFSAARRKDMKLARDRFTVLKQEASKLPDKGKPDSEPGEMNPTLEEEGAYQHAVCAAALGDKKAAEAEYLKFMKDYPESQLMNGVMMRLERLHDGHLPAYLEDAWQQTQKTALDRKKAQDREQSLCGPECLAELIRCRGEKADVHALAAEMKTSDRGTSMQSLADSAKKHGFTVKGVKLTWDGLRKQPLPLIALVAPGHYIIVDGVGWRSVKIWDAYGEGVGKPSTRKFSQNEWMRVWGGLALVLQPNSSVQSGRR